MSETPELLPDHRDPARRAGAGRGRPARAREAGGLPRAGGSARRAPRDRGGARDPRHRPEELLAAERARPRQRLSAAAQPDIVLAPRLQRDPRRRRGADRRADQAAGDRACVPAKRNRGSRTCDEPGAESPLRRPGTPSCRQHRHRSRIRVDARGRVGRRVRRRREGLVAEPRGSRWAHASLGRPRPRAAAREFGSPRRGGAGDRARPTPRDATSTKCGRDRDRSRRELAAAVHPGDPGDPNAVATAVPRQLSCCCQATCFWSRCSWSASFPRSPRAPTSRPFVSRSGLGIVVVEAAGNAMLNLGTLPQFDRASSSFQESGAILVGGGTSTFPHGRAGGTNFGARIDCYAWAENITTTSSSADDPNGGELKGDGTLADAATPETQRYTKLLRRYQRRRGDRRRGCGARPGHLPVSGVYDVACGPAPLAEAHARAAEGIREQHRSGRRLPDRPNAESG